MELATNSVNGDTDFSKTFVGDDQRQDHHRAWPFDESAGKGESKDINVSQFIVGEGLAGAETQPQLVQPADTQQSRSMTSGMEFGRSPDHHSELSGTHTAQFGQNLPLGVLGNLSALNMNVPNLSGLTAAAAAGMCWRN